MCRATVFVLALIAAVCLAACLDPPLTQPPPDEKQQVVIPLPYDLGWDAVTSVISQNSLHVQAQDMTNGIIEAAGPRFSVQDADCGKVKSVAGSYVAEPQANSSSVYNFLVRPRGPEATLVEVRATFNSSVAVPLHPATDVDCVSHGIQESNLLREVLVEAKKTRRPVYGQPAVSRPQTASNGAGSQPPSTISNPNRPPSTVAKDGPPPMQPLSTGGFSLLDPSHPLPHPNMPGISAPPSPPSQQ
jgi:hypothetical protein